MKKILLIAGMVMMMFGSFAKNVIVIEVHKEGAGWQNFFNCYREVTTTFVGEQAGTPCVNLTCIGAGYNWCRASREIGVINMEGVGPSSNTQILSNTTVVNAINELIEASELAYTRGTKASSASKKVAIRNGSKTDLLFINATWNYNDSSKKTGATIRITIEMDDTSLLKR